MLEHEYSNTRKPESTLEFAEDAFKTYVSRFEDVDHSPELLREVASAAEWIAKQKEFQPNGYVYILQSGPYYKIGRTRNPSARIKALKIQLPFRVKVVNLIPCENDIAAERVLHQLWQHHRVNGEWFKLPEKTVEDMTRWRVSIMSEINGTGIPLFHECHITLESQ